MAGPLLLTYNLDARTDARLRALCQKLHLRYRAVLPEEYGETLGALAGIPTKAADVPGPLASFSDPMLVMCHFLNTQFNAFLQGMRADGIRVPLKAVLTPSNVAWNAFELHDELAREHEAIQKGKTT